MVAEIPQRCFPGTGSFNRTRNRGHGMALDRHRRKTLLAKLLGSGRNRVCAALDWRMGLFLDKGQAPEVMTWFDKGFLAVYFLAIIIIQCIWQSRLIKAHKPIKHGWHGVYYALAILPMIYFFSAFWWQVVVIAVLARLAFFDPILNLCRGLPLFYNSDKKAGSIIDRIENHFSLWFVKVLKVCYIILFVVVLILIK